MRRELKEALSEHIRTHADYSRKVFPYEEGTERIVIA